MKNLLVILLCVGTAAFVFSCSKKNTAEKLPAKNYVLVHGAWQAPYVWDSVKTLLVREGNNVTVVELPGHGSDQTAPSTISLNLYATTVLNAMSQIPGKVILVGHSLGGMIISSVAEQAPSKIEKLVYLAGYLPASGQSLFGLAQTDPGSELGQPGALIFSSDSLTVDVAPNDLISTFIQDGTPQEQNLVSQNYRAEPTIPLTQPVTLTAANFGSVNKVYIKTLLDHAVSPVLQNKMIAAAPGVSAVYSINTSHSAHLAKPDSVAILLTKIGQN
ncbi:MAG TPA: alpha/beta fold hydrolase [Puia sp.]|nr:alpha/beta fold hydrolase [Puia sp.]